MDKRDEYLYNICTTGMTLVMTFLISKISGQFIRYLDRPSALFDDNILAGTFITLTCLIAIVGIIITLSVAHKEFNLPFAFINFIISIFFVSVPLFISADSINSSITFSDDKVVLKRESFVFGISLFIISFIFLLLYLFIVYFQNKKTSEIPTSKYFQIGVFHLAAILFGILCIFIYEIPRLLMFISFAAFLGSGFYLYFLWSTRSSIKENSIS